MSTSSPTYYSNIFGAAIVGDPDPEVIEFAPAKGLLPMGSIIALNAGKGELVKAGTEAAVYGVLLHDVNTDAAFSGGTVTGSVGRRGSYKAASLIVAPGTNTATLATEMRKLSLFLEGDIVVPVAAAEPSQEEAPAEPQVAGA
jgi:hypothetical protein